MTTAELQLETIRVDQRGRVLTATVIAPPLNFVTPAVVRDLDTLTATAERDGTVGAIVLTGGLPGRFLTHADPAALTGMIELPHPFIPARLAAPFVPVLNTALRIPGATRVTERLGGLGTGLVWGYRWKRTTLRMNRSRIVYLAAINGPALGGGHEIALACDLRYAADAEHVKFGQIESLANLIPGGGGTQRLPRLIGAAKAIELTLEGAPVDAATALRLGLVHRLTPETELLAETQSTAARLAARNPVVVAELKRAIYFGPNRPLPRGLDHELAAFLSTGTTKSATRTTKAFFEDLDRLADTPFLAAPKAWLDGTRVDQTSD
ncbi:enoyl-CoA hydratase/isomerase family protein [Nocardia arthritidis]|uniref:Enoyl-CoA hydratase/isomerase family protein n=1 Tax=Nocardia arthritidis TaxID=228602 RepID=A0A6G9YGM2_9NOCA|nr:enoyl-CoA hydratase/isomerase family protein [Nocardia arthritidis]QIS12290.1 enoyl-CoA hydratase/isomerase family protein [Nocardia arthritidis]